ncbi:phosphate transport system substrate-binding protein [Amycolatopsis arida]|uniref:Phosphate-binding protein n=1 Tax=Amycolatopsis arida TaxID=587909 RepID=A0A1I5SW24_9PSEU|nr:phosphate ABC transporter substrate-binding protein PstS [Amycolatopsis arida]TDX96342.1 phosphate transport system substrate-binding protein [Amycolatopsis arida]SFP74426.1 phosphate transport system substrate-binding protein [Amycolatopsis arida]
MKIKRHAAFVSLLAAGTLALSACGTDQNAPQDTGQAAAPTGSADVECGGKENLVAEGSSAQKGAMDVFSQAYNQRCEGQRLAYTASGSGNGVKQFIGGQVDIGGSDSPLSEEKGEVAKAAERCQGNPAWNLPMVFGPVAVAYHLEGVDSLVLTPELVAKIFNGGITNWNDPAIAAVNPGTTLPDKKITVFYRGDESGTTDNFQKYLSAAAGDVWTQGDGKTFHGGVGEGKDKSAGVADAVGGVDGGITYVEWSFAQDKGLSIARLDSGAGPVELTAETASNALKHPTIEGEGNDLRLDLDALYASKEPNSYPLLLATYEIVCSAGYDPETAKAVKAFLTVAATDAQANLEPAGYIPVPQEFQDRLLTAIKAIS